VFPSDQKARIVALHAAPSLDTSTAGKSTARTWLGQRITRLRRPDLLPVLQEDARHSPRWNQTLALLWLESVVAGRS